MLLFWCKYPGRPWPWIDQITAWKAAFISHHHHDKGSLSSKITRCYMIYVHCHPCKMISYFLNHSAQTIFNLRITTMCSLLIHNLIHKNFVLQLKVTGSRVARGQKWQVLGPQDIPLSRVTMVENIQINLLNQNIESMIQFFKKVGAETKRAQQEICAVWVCVS